MTTNDRPAPPPEPPVPAAGQPAPPPPPPTPATDDRWRDLGWAARAVYAALVADALVVIYALATLFEQRSLVPDSLFNAPRADLLRLIELDDRIDTMNDVYLALIVITGVAMITWTWRAAKNNLALDRTQARFGTGWAIWGWVIPLANFVIPVLIVQDLWRGSDPSVPRGDARWKIGNRSLLVGFWWGLLIFGRLLVAVGANRVNEGRQLDDLEVDAAAQIVGNFATISAAVLAILVVSKITGRQRECLRVQHAQWNAPPPPVSA